jgi:dihydrodipicolinate synthase/N-acetylneuraminate lyase
LARYSATLAVVDNALMWPLSAMLGATGFITHLGTVWPEYVISLGGLLKAGKYSEAMDSMREKKWPWMQFRLAMEKYTGGESPPVRAALELCGRPGGPYRPPSRDLGGEQRRELSALLKRIGVAGA